MTRRLADAGLASFVAIVALQHALEPQLAPSRHEISEYANTGTGALMIVAFLAWAGSLLATATFVAHPVDRWTRSRGPIAIAALLGVAGIGVVLTACFPTQTSAGALPPGTRLTTTGRIHDLASGAASLALLAAAATSVVAVRAPTWFPRLAAATLAIAVPAAAVLLAVGAPVEGIRQRVLVAAACVWQGALIRAVGSGQQNEPSVSHL
jgi:hypothetical protein